MSTFNPVIVHYHLFPGGVSRLILGSLRSLVEQGMLEGEIRFALGTLERSEWFFRALAEQCGNRIRIRTEVMPELMYWDETESDWLGAAERIKSALMTLCGGGRILWAHNPTLGKNPAYLSALKRIAEEVPEFRMFLHVHDCAEQGRWTNLALMRRTLTEPYYFVSPGARWLVINQRAYQAFLDSGMPKSSLFYFPDLLPVPDPGLGIGEKAVLEQLSAYAKRESYGFDLSAPKILFAGRTIRRKNLLETALLLHCSPKRPALLITLPSDSSDDKPYENQVFHQIKKHRMGVAGFGPELVGHTLRLADLAQTVRFTISASVMEGFGLPYLEFPLLGKPLFARSIEIMSDFSDIKPLLPHHYYSSFRVPISKATADCQHKRYREKIELLSHRFRIPEDYIEQTQDFFGRQFESLTPDFSFLSASEQFDLLDKAEEGFVRDVYALNRDLYQEFEDCLTDAFVPIQDTSKAIDLKYGPLTHARNLQTILNSFEAKTAEPFDSEGFQKKLLEKYFRPSDLRLLLDYRPIR